ncbi:hypothetical protein RN001_008301 [Aquatica leii]|uniref:Serpin domain-containing protein n=1 Tax=Aquatica leii TaxID=1421715 RepID=A0AAN7SRA9_9COLE|nr:hypothetical protein RN001_008301 [Aquatica leii]
MNALSHLFIIGFLTFVKGYGAEWRTEYSYPEPTPQEIMVDTVNYIGLVLLHTHNQNNGNNIALSPYGATSVLVALTEGLQGKALKEILDATHLPLKVDVTRIGLRDIHRHLKSYFIPQEGFLAGLTFSHENVTLKESYIKILKFYGFDIDAFNSALYPDVFTTPLPLTTFDIKENKTKTNVTATTSMPLGTTHTLTETTQDINTKIEVVNGTTNLLVTTSKTESTMREYSTSHTVSTAMPDTTLSAIKETTLESATETSSTTKKSKPTTTISAKPTNETSISNLNITKPILTPTSSATKKTTPLSATTTTTTTIPNVTTKVTKETTTIVPITTMRVQPTSTRSTTTTTTARTTIALPPTTTTTPTISSKSMAPASTKSTTSTTTERITTVQSDTTIKSTTAPPITTIRMVPNSTTSTMSTTTKRTITTIPTETTIKTTAPLITTMQMVPSSVTSTTPTTTAKTTTTSATKTSSTPPIITMRIVPTGTTSTTSSTTLKTTTTPATTTTHVPTTIPTTTPLITTNENETTVPPTNDPTKTTTVTTDFTSELSSDDVMSTTTETITEITTVPTTTIKTTAPITTTKETSKTKRSVPIDISAKIKIKTVKYKTQRPHRSPLDYLIAKYHDTNAPSHIISRYEPIKPKTFLVNGKIRESNISFMTYDTVLPFRYISYLNALAVTFPLDSTKYYLLLVLPIEETGVDSLVDNIMSTTLKQIIYNLQPTRVKATIPSFMLKGFVILTPTLQKLGIRSIFEPRRADFYKMTNAQNIYVTNVEQAITVTIRNYVNTTDLYNNEIYQRRGPVVFNADHPFLYFVMDSEIHVALMAGKIINPLNSRIR